MTDFHRIHRWHLIAQMALTLPWRARFTQQAWDALIRMDQGTAIRSSPLTLPEAEKRRERARMNERSEEKKRRYEEDQAVVAIGQSAGQAASARRRSRC